MSRIFVMNFFSFPTYVNFSHFTLSVFCFCFCVLLTLFRIEASYILLIKVCYNLLLSLHSLWGDSLYVFILLWKYGIGAILYSLELHESLVVMVSVVVGFLYISVERLLRHLDKLMSRKLISLSISFSRVNFILGISLLKPSMMSFMLVLSSLYMIRI